MGDVTSRSHHPTREAAEVAGQVVELLEIMWERERGRDAVSPSPVSASQLRVLYGLEREEGINLRRLGEVLGSAASSVSRLCDRIEALGFVERAPSPASRRELELRLTGRGRAYLAQLRTSRERALHEVIASMAPSARRALILGLQGFRDAVEETEPGRRPTTQDDPAESA